MIKLLGVITVIGAWTWYKVSDAVKTLVTKVKATK